MRYFITVGRQNENKKTFGLRIFRPNAEEGKIFEFIEKIILFIKFLMK